MYSHIEHSMRIEASDEALKEDRRDSESRVSCLILGSVNLACIVSPRPHSRAQ
jgi:hypothetical protein